MSTLLIRELDYGDLTKVIALERRVFPAPWSMAMFVLELSKPAGICVAAEVDDEFAGYLICSRYDTVWHIMNICVEPVLRRTGVASALLAHLFDQVGDDDARYTLEVRPSNPAGIGLYEHHGFLAAGMRRRYYADNGEDAIIMWRTPGTLRGVLDDIPNASPVQP
jgi:[ribosomal protein S18]-alanine N-acetyltransferase